MATETSGAGLGAGAVIDADAEPDQVSTPTNAAKRSSSQRSPEAQQSPAQQSPAHQKQRVTQEKGPLPPLLLGGVPAPAVAAPPPLSPAAPGASGGSAAPDLDGVSTSPAFAAPPPHSMFLPLGEPLTARSGLGSNVPLTARRAPPSFEDALPGLEDTGEYTYFSGYLDAGVPPSGKGKMYFAPKLHQWW